MISLPTVTAAAAIATATITTATAAATVAATATAAATTTVTATATAAATTVTATTAAATKAAWTLFLRTSFIDGQGTALEVEAVQGLDSRLHRLCRRHGHESKATWAAGFAVHRKVDVGDITILREQFTHVEFGRAEGQIAHIHLGIHYQVISSGLDSLLIPDMAPDAGFNAHHRIQRLT